MKFAVGFDAYIDRIAGVVEKRTNERHFEYYKTIESYAKRILNMSKKSGDLEIVTKVEKYGGNAPLMAGGLAALGTDVTLCSPLGDNPVFESLKSKLTYFNIGSPATSLNLEFEDGKVMMGENLPLNSITLENLKKRDDYPDMLKEIYSSDLVSFCNWSQMENILPLYAELLSNPKMNGKTVFFDLCDFTKKPVSKIYKLLELVSSDKYNSLIGLNENEAELLANIIGVKRCTDKLTYTENISNRIGCGIVIHSRDWSALCYKQMKAFEKGSLVAVPKVSTGGGDHFNAGFCFALISGFSPAKILKFAMGTSRAFVATGESPSCTDVLEYINNK